MDPSDNAVLTWTQSASAGGRGGSAAGSIWASSAKAGSRWIGAVRISSAGSDCFQSAVTRGARIVAVFVCRKGRKDALWSTSRAASGGAWTRPVRIAATSQDNDPGVAVTLDSGGAATALWNGAGGLYSATLANGAAAWSSPARALPDTEWTASVNRLVTTVGGVTTLAWRSYNGPTHLEALTRPAGLSAWNAPQSFAPTAARAGVSSTGHGTLFDGGYELAADGAGNIVAAWKQSTLLDPPLEDGEGRPQDTRSELLTATRSPDGTWSAPTLITSAFDGRDYRNLALAGNARGDVTLAWADLGEDFGGDLRGRIRAVSHGPGGTWSAPAQLAAAPNYNEYSNTYQRSGGLTVLVAGHGRATVSWTYCKNLDAKSFKGCQQQVATRAAG